MSNMIQYFAEVNQLFWNGSPFQWAFYISIILILVFEKNKTKRMLFSYFPIIMYIGIYNPLTYLAIELFFDGSKLYYVRLYSIVPVFYCLAHGCILALNRTKGMIKMACVCALAALLAFAGHSIYSEPWMQPAANLEKTPGDAFAVLEAIPREKENVTVAFPDPLNVYMRQLDGTLITPYGRYMNALGKAVSEAVPDVSYVMTTAGKQYVDYVVVNKNEESREAFAESGYQPVGETLGYLVYPVNGVPRNERELNEKRQVTFAMSLDEDKNPIINVLGYGYAALAYEYDQWGNRCKMTYLDTEGKLFTVVGGYKSVQKQYGLMGLVESIRYLDDENQPVLVSGRYETKYLYDSNQKVIQESYYDQNGLLMNRTDEHYAIKLIEHDKNQQVIHETYLDTDQKPVARAGIFSEIKREYDSEGNIVKETFFNEKGEAINLKESLLQDKSINLLGLTDKDSTYQIAGITYAWNDGDSCHVEGTAKGGSCYSILSGERPYYLFNGEKYMVHITSKKVYAIIYCYSDKTLKEQISKVAGRSDFEFTVPPNCNGVIFRLWVDSDVTVDETIDLAITPA